MNTPKCTLDRFGNLDSSVCVKIDKNVMEQLRRLYVDMTEGGDVTEYAVRLDVGWPSPYRGRFGAGKANWTIDISEGETFSRTKQVRLRVNDDCTATFDAEKLRHYVNEKVEIITKFRQRRQLAKEAVSKIPKLPLGMHVVAMENETYHVEMNVQLVHLILLADFVRSLKQQ